MNAFRFALPIAALTLALSACSSAVVSVDSGIGADPELPEPNRSLIPKVNIAVATGWHDGQMPTAAADMSVLAFAGGLQHPRWVYVLPNGDVLVAETNAPERPEENKGIRAWFMKRTMKKAGAGVPSADRITLLRDTDGDGVADMRSVFIENLHSPFGMALVGDMFYVANTDAVIGFAYTANATSISAVGTRLTDLPAGERNHHWTKNLIAGADGSKLYATVGSNSNVAENGMDVELGRAAIWEIDIATGSKRLYASGLRNPNGMAWEPSTGMLWTAVNERDELGDNLVPDYMTSVRDGGFYGWPYSYYGQHIDNRVKPQRPDLVASALVPDYALGAHTASLGLAYSGDNALARGFQNGMFVGQHGSWNRKPRSGYKVIFVPFVSGKPAGPPRDVLTGFLDHDEARGRPVGVAMDAKGALLIADDVGNVIWRVAADQPD